MRSTTRIALGFTLAAGVLVGCSTAPATQESRKELLEKATTAMTEMNREHPEAGAFASKGSGYAIFPEVTKGGLGFGGAYGRGVVYERGQHIGYADMKQGSFGLQIGGQTYSELIVFETKAALERFQHGRLEFAADASAVIVKTGVATNARFVDGIAIIVRPIAGAMVEASVGGQQLTYVPK
jgi:lipid-binding SYLF domain-containing protein